MTSSSVFLFVVAAKPCRKNIGAKIFSEYFCERRFEASPGFASAAIKLPCRVRPYKTEFKVWFGLALASPQKSGGLY